MEPGATNDEPLAKKAELLLDQIDSLRVLRADRRRLDALRVVSPRDLVPPEERGSQD